VFFLNLKRQRAGVESEYVQVHVSGLTRVDPDLSVREIEGSVGHPSRDLQTTAAWWIAVGIGLVDQTREKFHEVVGHLHRKRIQWLRKRNRKQNFNFDSFSKFRRTKLVELMGLSRLTSTPSLYEVLYRRIEVWRIAELKFLNSAVAV